MLAAAAVASAKAVDAAAELHRRFDTRDDVTTVPAFAVGDEQSAVAEELRGVELGEDRKSLASLLRFTATNTRFNWVRKWHTRCE